MPIQGYFGRLSRDPEELALRGLGTRDVRQTGVGGQIEAFQQASQANQQRQQDRMLLAQQLAAKAQDDLRSEATIAEQRARSAQSQALQERNAELDKLKWQQQISKNNAIATEQMQLARSKEDFNQAQIDWQRSQMSKNQLAKDQQQGGVQMQYYSAPGGYVPQNEMEFAALSLAQSRGGGPSPASSMSFLNTRLINPQTLQVARSQSR